MTFACLLRQLKVFKYDKHCNLLSGPVLSFKLESLYESLFSKYYATKSEIEYKENKNANPELGFVRGGFNVSMFPLDRIRNFCIIAHIDHGKSTLADRMMEMTGAISKGLQSQFLDKLQVERERGITVKAQTVSLVYRHAEKDYLLNLIDTPGHVDFSYEVSRSLAACQGALLLVDASQGIQAQTVANFYLAFEQGLDLVPVLNKIDLPGAEPDRVATELQLAFDFEPSSMLRCSAKTGVGVHEVLDAVIEHVSPPKGDPHAPLRILLFDAFYDCYRGVVCLVEVVDGELRNGRKLVSSSTKEEYEIQEVGVMAPDRHPTGVLKTGQVGYMVSSIKELHAARVGDTWWEVGKPAEPLPGFMPAKSMVFAGLFPISGDEIDQLRMAMEKLALNDASVVVKKESCDALGPGFRCGFLGALHMEVFMTRLEQEFGAEVVTTAPTVPYRVTLANGTVELLESASQFAPDKAVKIEEPIVSASIIAPHDYTGAILTLVAERRGELLDQSIMPGATGNASRVLLRVGLPLAELAGNFYGDLKSLTRGYASFDYEPGPYRESDLVRLDLLVTGKQVDALARIVHRNDVLKVGRALCLKLGEIMEKQQFEVVIQATCNGKIITRETLKALRKDVTSKCYGGDVTRRRKLLDKQKEGKKRMKRLGNIDVPQEAFPELMRIR